MWFRYSERRMVELFANRGDPDQTPYLHNLPITLLGVYRLQWVYIANSADPDLDVKLDALVENYLISVAETISCF